MKKVLFITFYWPPSGRATLHWPLDIIKYLPEYGWQPSVLTVKEDTFSTSDHSLSSQVDPNMKVVRTDYFDPFVIYRKFLGKAQDEPLVASEMISKTNRSLKHRLTIWIRMNLFVPDARAGWFSYALKAGRKMMQQEKYDAIVSIGPPHSSHLIARRLAKKFNVPHTPVLIDPWTDIVYYTGFKRSYLTLKLDNHFEREVMKDARDVVFVTTNTKEDFVSKYPWIKDKSHVIYWGYNGEAFKGAVKKDNNAEEVLLHAGNIFDYQNPPGLWKVISELNDKGRKIKLRFIGTVSPAIKKAISDAGLDGVTEYRGFLPYSEVVSEIISASALLVCATEKRHVPGKLFEYMRSGRPVLAFGEENDEVAGLLKRAGAGMLFKYTERPDEFFARLNEFRTDMEYVEGFDREKLTGKMGEILSSQFSVLSAQL